MVLSRAIAVDDADNDVEAVSRLDVAFDDLTISSALADLAATTGDQPVPLTAIEDRARRMRRRRRAGRAGIVVLCVASLATGIGLAGSGGRQPSELTAFGAGPGALPLCASILAQSTPAPLAKGSGAVGRRVQLDPLVVPPTVGEKFKAPGTITGTPTADAVTILVAAPLNPTSQPVTFAITRETQFFEGDQPSGPRILRAGGKVGFVATKTGQASYRLDQIDTNPGSAAGASQRSPNSAASPFPARDSGGGKTGLPPVGQAVLGKGFLAKVPASRTTTVRVTVAGGPLAGDTVPFAVTPATRFVSGGRQCDPAGLPAGVPAGFSATRTGTASYRLDQLNLT